MMNGNGKGPFDGVTQEQVRAMDDGTLRLNIYFGMKSIWNEMKDMRTDFPTIAAEQAKLIVDNAIAACAKKQNSVQVARARNENLYISVISLLGMACTFLAGVHFG